MFDEADTFKRGYLSKEQLMEVIKDDIINGHVEYQRRTSGKSQLLGFNTVDSDRFSTTTPAINQSKLNASTIQQDP